MFKILRFVSKQRVRRASEFSVIFKKGKSFTEGCFVCHALKTERDYARLGIVINKRHAHLATTRNHIRRLIRERFRLLQHQLTGFDVVISLRSSLDKNTVEEKAQCIEKLFSQLLMHCGGVSSS